MIRITSKKDGFRRCGIAHPKQATEYPADRFTPEQIETLQAEPLLVVELLDDPDEGKTKGKSKGKSKETTEPPPEP